MSDKPITWKRLASDDYIAEAFGYTLRVESMDKRYWWSRASKGDFFHEDYAGSKHLAMSHAQTAMYANMHIEALRLLKDLCELQNGAPLETHRAQWEATMNEVYEHLAKFDETDT